MSSPTKLSSSSSRGIIFIVVIFVIIASGLLIVTRHNRKWEPPPYHNVKENKTECHGDCACLNNTKDDEPVAKVLVKHPVIAPEDNVCPRDTRNLTWCTDKPVFSEKLNVSYDLLTFDELVHRYGNDLSEGGHFRPANCLAKQNVAIVIPYRDRESNLKMLMNNLHPFLKRQDVEYTVIVVEQLPGSKFNRGMVKNIGFFEARKICYFDCVFFHDVDMTPDDYGNVYQCGEQPRQHSRNLARWGHKTPFYASFGGVVSMKPEQFIAVNGYSNTYFEWGGEDNELGNRVLFHHMNKTYYPFNIATYQEFNHAPSQKFDLTYHWFKNWKSRVKGDGLTTLYYTLKGVIHKPLFTHILVSINETLVKEIYHGNIATAGEKDIPNSG